MSDDNAVSTEAEEREPGSTHTSAQELGDITAQRLPGGLRKLAQTVGTEGDGVDYYRFTLSEEREVRLGLKLRQGEAELYLEDAEGNVLARSMAHAGYEAAVRTLLPGTYYVRVEAVGAAASEYEFRYGVLEANASFRPASDSPWHTGEAEKMGMPSFGEAGYGFELSETVDGRVSGVLLGTVLAVDPNGEELSYRIVGGNGSELFALGGASGELSYVGAGEDFEGGVTSYELTIRASDGTHTIDTTVTVTVTDAAEQPAFGDGSYAFELAENADGRANGLSLGRVLATDPDGDEVRYSLTGGNESRLFNIDAASGELYYVGPGEDYESGVTSYEVTVRASDAAHTVDTTVTVTVTDEGEAPAFVEESYAFELAENVDGRVNQLSLGTVTATDPDSDTVRYSLLGGNDSSLFAVEETSGELFYVGAGEDYEGGVTSYEVTVRASDAAHTVDTTVTVTVTDAAEAPAFGEESYAFELAENVDGRVNRLSLGTVTATDPDSDTVRYSLLGGNDSSLFAIEETSGELFYVGAGEDFEGGVTSYEVTVRASDAAHTVDTTVMVTVTDAAEAPAFGEKGYAFELAENVDGRVNRLSLGTVTATDPDSDTVRYSLLDGNDSSLFAIEETSGELFYVGAGEDFEGGVTSYEVTVRASDAAHTVDTTVTVTVTDAAEAPGFGEEGYAFELAENVDGRVNRLSLGTVTATDPDSDTVRYSLLGGNDSSLFAIEETSGELFYVGAGEDFEGGVTSYELTVRASDAAHTVDTTVTVTVTDAAEAPAFGEESYAFELAENVDGRVNRLSLGTVTATDPDSDTVRYSLLGGNDSSLFAIEETSGELFYVGAGEDFEDGVTSYEVTVRASDAAHTVDTTVTVTVTDEGEAPAFGEKGYAFELAENVDGRVNGLSLGTVTATDPDSDTVRYSLLDGNDSSLFAIEETSGELFYVGAGEDFEGGVTSYEVTVRASDAAHTVDTTVTVTVTDEGEAPAFGEKGYAFELAENVDGRVNGLSLGTVTATDPDSDTVRYSLLGGNDSSLFNIDADTGEVFYVGSGEDYEGGVTSYELTVRASDGTHASDTTVRVALGDVRGHSEPEGGDLPQDRTTTGLVLVDEAPVTGNIESTWDLDWFAVELVAGRTYRIDFRGQPTGDGTLVDPFLYGVFDGDGRLIPGTTIPDGGTSHNSRLVFTAPREGTYYIATSGNGTYPSGTGTYELEVRDVRAPVFAEAGYRFAFSENAEGSVNRQSLGTVTATDPDGGTVRYRLVGGDESRRFAIDPDTGEVFYVGPGEDYESRVTSYEVTVGASDGAYSTEVTVTVTVTDAPEAPAFAEESYAFELAENVDGSDERLSLGTVMATDPDDDAVRYSLAGGNETELFAIGAASGELYYVGGGEDYESGVTSYELTVQASDGTHPVDTMVTVTVVDDPFDSEKSTGPQGSSEPASADLPAGRETSGEVRVDAEPVDGTLRSPSDRDWFAVTLAPGRTYVFALEGDTPRSGTGATPAIRGLRDANGNPVAGIVGGTEVRYATDAAAAEAVYYIEVGGEGGSGQGTSATRGFGTRSIVETRSSVATRSSVETRSIVETRSSSDRGTGYRLRAHDITETKDATDDYPPATSTTGVVTVDGSVTGTIERSGDRDWFAVDLEAGRFYQIDLKGFPTGDGTLHDPYLRGVYDDNGVLLDGTGDDDGGVGRNSRVFFIAPEGTTYYVAAGAYAYQNGTYTLSVTEVDGGDFLVGTGTSGDDYRSDVMTTGKVMVGGSVRGEIEHAHDQDWFAVTLVAGKIYRINLQRVPGDADRSYPYLPHPYQPGVHDSEGNLIDDTTHDYGGHFNDSRVYYFAATEDGIHYVSAGYRGYITGTYRLSVTEMDDAQTAGIDTTGTVTVGGSVTGNINFPGDRDWFAVTLVTGRTYHFDLEGAPNSTRTLLDPYLRGVYDSEGNLIGDTTDNDGGFVVNSRVALTATQDGTHYVSASGNGNRTGTYRLSVTEVADVQTAGTDTSGTVSVGGKVRGMIELPDDQDWFAVTLVAGTTYRIDLEGVSTYDGTLNDPYLHGVYDSEGRLIGETTDDDGGEGRNSQVSFKTTEGGTYVRTYYVSAGTDGSGTGTYELSVTQVDRLNAVTEISGTVLVGGSVMGEIGYVSERDWFAVTLVAGTVYHIDLEGSRTGAGALAHPHLRGVYDLEGNRLGGTGIPGGYNNERIVFAATADGVHYVSASGNGNRTGTYRLSVTEIEDAHTAGTDTSGTVLVGGSVTGEIDYWGDRDWFAVTLVAGTTYRIDLEGQSNGAGTLAHTFLRGVYDLHGNLIGDTTDAGSGFFRNSRVFVRATENAIYYVAADAKHYDLGTYRLSVTDAVAADAQTAGTDTSGTVPVGGSVTDEIDYPNERDWFAVTLVAGTTYRIDLEGQSNGAGTLYDPYLHGVYDSHGDLIGDTTADDGGSGRNSRVRFTATEGGIHYVSAGADGSGTGTYRLSVTDVDAQTAGTDTSGTVSVGGSVTEEIGYADDRDWFAVTLVTGTTYRIDLEGTPTGAGTLGDPYLYGVYNSQGNLIGGTTDDDGGSGRNSRVFYEATEDGIHYVSAGAVGTGEGTYKLSVTEVDPQTAGTDTSGTVSVDGSVTGEIDFGGDRDWFAVTLEADTTYRVDLEGTSTDAGTLADPYLRGIYDSRGNLIGSTTDDNDGVHLNSQVFFAATEGGIYYVSVGAEGSETGTYRLSVTDVVAADAQTAGTDTTGTVRAGGSVTGEIDYASDRDWFAVTLEAGKSYRIDLEGSPTSAGTLDDPYLFGVHDSVGNLIGGTTDDDSGVYRNSRVDFEPTQGGRYYVSVGADGIDTGTYTLSIEEGL